MRERERERELVLDIGKPDKYVCFYICTPKILSINHIKNE